MAASEAAREIAAIREKADAEVQAAKRRLGGFVAAIAQLEAENETETVRADDLARPLEEAKAAAHAVAIESTAREASLTATAGQLCEQLAALKDELREAHREAKEATTQLARVNGQLEAMSSQVAEQVW
ncbi:hypothetical protein D5047_13100 [Verminephrobacter eiseniae]|nr:hypothetical protein [Verminephrobacter eiseniae]